ncbi:sigma-70 family RNA polymerase sigma factor [Burkholderia ubonensis]|uniref:sigma-70 family RNA polymerase sigma factor n=1 Tax=Burkholderia ubonensis TaxID=101571 RepID=UPI000B0C2FE1|nr:sigma-70 family RNA polymerase sigma factor [Burkholderia ubonensis]
MTKPAPDAVRPIGRLFKIAVSAGIESAVKLHIGRGDNLECRDEKGLTPLMIAASRGRAGVCRLLINAGADVFATDHAGRDALAIAREFGASAAAEIIAATLDQLASRENCAAEASTSVGDTEPSATALRNLTTGHDLEAHSNAEPAATDLSSQQTHHKYTCNSETDATERSAANQFEDNSQLSALESRSIEISRSTIFAKKSRVEQVTPAENLSDGNELLEVAAPCTGSESRSIADSCDLNTHLPDAGLLLLSQWADGVQASDNAVPDEQIKTSNLRAVDHQATIELTFGDWEAVVTTEPPQENLKVVTAEAERQRHIDSHMPIDHSAGWDDFDAFLPELASPQLRVGDHEFRQSLRKLLLRALREGSVPQVAVEDALFGRGDDEDHRLRTEATLKLILNDLGADIDERLEFSSEIPSDNFEVFVDPVETVAEEAEVDGAVLHFEELLSDGNDPLRMYYRAIAKHSLLTAEQEIELARKMEDAVSCALDALASWPLGLNHFLGEIDKANAGTSSLSTIVDLAGSDAGDADSSADSDENTDIDPDFVIDQGEDSAPPALTSGDETKQVIDDIFEVFSNIRVLATESLRAETTKVVRHELGRLRFRRPFLISLDRVSLGDCHPSASAYRSSIAQLIHSRNYMAQANVRLVMDIARRKQHSGLSLEDLIQEGNLGLLKAIDRFDWRRGFRFSTMATWWIKQQLGRGIFDTALTIRLPVHVHEKVSRSNWEIESLERMHGKSISLAGRAAICNMSPDKYELVARAISAPLSIADARREGWFESEDADEPFARLAASEEARLVDKLLAKLKRNEAEVLRLRFGIRVNEHRTLEQIGEIFGVTRERVRQIEAKAMRRLLSAPYYDPLAKAVGRAPLLRQKAIDEEEVPIGDDAARTNMTSTHSSESSTASKTQTRSNASCPTFATSVPISNSAHDSIPKSMQRLLDLAHELGVSVSRDLSGSGADFVFGEIEQQNIKARKLIRELLGMGYTWEPGKGYRQ